MGPHDVRVRLLGSFQIIVSEPAITGLAARKAQELLALVLLAPQRTLLREAAAEHLWPGMSSDASKKAIRQALWQIHQTTDTYTADVPRLVLTEGDFILVNPARRVWVDVAAFVDAVRAPEIRTARNVALSEAQLEAMTLAAELHRGSLLSGCYADWCLVHRQRVEDLYITLLDRLSLAHEHRGERELAIHWAEALLEAEPAHERTHRRLMRLYYACDDRTRALRQYQRCRRVLEDELGIRPSLRTSELAAAIGVDDVGSTSVPAQHRARGSDGVDAVRGELDALRETVEAMRDEIRLALG